MWKLQKKAIVNWILNADEGFPLEKGKIFNIAICKIPFVKNKGKLEITGVYFSSNP